VFVFLGCIVFSGCILQPAFAQNCIGLDGKMLKIPALAKIAEENGNDRWLAIMKQGERLALLSKRLTTPWFYFSPDSEPEKVIRQKRGIAASHCLQMAAKDKFVSAENLDPRRVFTSTQIYQKYLPDISFNSTFKGSAKEFRITAQKETNRQMAKQTIFDQIGRGLDVQRAYRRNRDLNTYKSDTTKVLLLLQRIRNGDGCSPEKACKRTVNKYFKRLYEAVYKAGGSISGGPTQAAWKAGIDAEKRKREMAKARAQAAAAKRKSGNDLTKRSQLLLLTKFPNQNPKRMKYLLERFDPKQDPNFRIRDFENNRTPRCSQRKTEIRNMFGSFLLRVRTRL
jgi:hypothetical protein